MRERPTILLTGFGAFPGVPVTATTALVPRVEEAAREMFPSHAVIGEILPVHWEDAPTRLKTLIDRENIALVLHLGVSESAEGFQLELVGRNRQIPREDISGSLPRTAHVIETGPDILATTLPVERIAARLLGCGYPCKTSDDAGSYLCNTLLYHSLTAAWDQPEPYLAGFIHVPAALTGHGGDGLQAHPDSPIDWKAAVSGTLEIISACVDHLAEQKGR